MRQTVVVFLLLIGSNVLGQVVLEPDYIIERPPDSRLFGRYATANDHHFIVNDRIVLDRSTGEVLRELEFTGANGTFSEDDTDGYGDKFVVGMASGGTQGKPHGQVFIFNTLTGEQLHHLDFEHPDITQGNRWGTTVSISETYVAATDDAAQAAVFDVQTGEHLWGFYPENDSLRGIHGSVDILGDKVAISSPGRIVDGERVPGAFVFDAATGEELLSIEGSADDVFGIATALSPEALYVLSERSIHSYDFAGNLLNSYHSPEGEVTVWHSIGQQFEYAGGFLRIGSEIFSSELELMFQLQGGGRYNDEEIFLSGIFQNSGIYHIAVTSVPEPSCVWPSVAALGILLLFRKKRFA